MTESVKVHRKDQSVKDFTSKYLFLLFWPILCISLIFLIEIWSFCTNLLENNPAHKIDQLPFLRILSLCMDHSMQTRINSLYLFLLFLFMPLAVFGQNDVSLDPYNCFSLYNSLGSSTGTQVFPMLGSIPQYMDHLLISLLLTCRYFPIDSYAWIVSKSGLSSCSFSDRMTLVDHMQIFLVMETPQGSDWMPIMPHWFQ